MKPETPDTTPPTVASRQLSLVSPQALEARPGLASRVIDRVLPGNGRLLLFCWLCAVVLLGVVFGSLNSNSTRFYGIAESQAQSISFQYPVEIVEIPVVAGQQVMRDTRMLEVRRYDLDVELAIIEDKINEISSGRATARRTIAANIERLDGERLAATETLTTKIQNLATRYRLNQALAASVSTASESESAAGERPMLVHIDGLKSERRQIEKLYQSRMARLKQELGQKEDPDTARIAELQKQKQELFRQSHALSIVAPFDGSIGSIAFKPGEQVEAFNEVMSVIGSSTRQIKAYIHEAVLNEARLGQPVWIQPLDAGGEPGVINGRIKSMGSRIVEYPARLKRNLMVSAWGREVVVEVEQNSDLLVGEKVAVLLKKPQPALAKFMSMANQFLPVSSVLAKVSGEPRTRLVTPAALESALPGIDANTIEASGLVDAMGRNSYYLVSDEHATIFELDSTGKVVSALQLPQASAIKDIESISRDGGQFYVLASLSPNRAGKFASGRRKLARFSLAGNAISNMETVDLYQVLENISRQPDLESGLKPFLMSGLNQLPLEIEAHRVVRDVLYLGFKKPFNAEGKIVLMSIDPVQNLYSGGPIDSRLWIQLDLRHPTGNHATRLTDFDITSSGLYLLSVDRKQGKVSSLLWHYGYVDQKLNLLTSFENLNAEGISVNADETLATIVFDGGGRSPSRVVQVAL